MAFKGPEVMPRGPFRPVAHFSTDFRYNGERLGSRTQRRLLVTTRAFTEDTRFVSSRKLNIVLYNITLWELFPLPFSLLERR